MVNWTKKEENWIRVSLPNPDIDTLSKELGRAHENTKKKAKELEYIRRLRETLK